MLIEMYKLSDGVLVELTPETLEEEESIRGAKILHKNKLMVYWGDTFELYHRGDYMGYSGLKIFLETEEKNNVSVEETEPDDSCTDTDGSDDIELQ